VLNFIKAFYKLILHLVLYKMEIIKSLLIQARVN
jgi:hypothetical protein